jgi:hypothetical protein
MASKSKKKTTMAKLNREAAVREKRVIKQARKEARKLAAASPETHEPETETDVPVEDMPVSHAPAA